MECLVIAVAIIINAVWREVTEQRTRELTTQNHNDMIALGTVSIDAEIQNAYQLGYNTAINDSKRMDN